MKGIKVLIKSSYGEIKLEFYSDMPMEMFLASADLLLERWGLAVDDVEVYIKPRWIATGLWKALLPYQKINP